MKDQVPAPRFAQPPSEYRQSYFSILTGQLFVFLRELLSQGPVSVGSLMIDPNGLPTAATGLKAGTVFVDGGTLKVVMAVAKVEVSGVQVDAAVGDVTVLTP